MRAASKIIHTPSLAYGKAEDKLQEATTRIHNRFQGQLVSMIESADWGNFKLTKHPIECHHPDFRSYGHFCDLVLAKREAEVVALMEVKTRSMRPEKAMDASTTISQVMESMGPRLMELKQAAYEQGALWIVAVGVYSTPAITAAHHWSTDFKVVMCWGREVGEFAPTGQYSWESMASLDRSMMRCREPHEFWAIKASLMSQVKQLISPEPEADDVAHDEVMYSSSTLFDHVTISETDDLEEIIRNAPLVRHLQLTLLALANWPNEEAVTMRSQLEPYEEPGASMNYMRKNIGTLASLGVVVGFKRHSQRQRLSLDRAGLIKYLQSI